MSRTRQFSTERHNILRNNSLSQSKSSLKSGNLGQISSVKLHKQQFQTPKNNKNISNSQISKKSSTSEYICVGCINHNLSSQKKERNLQQKLRQRDIDRQNMKFSRRSDHDKQAKNQKLLNQAIKAKQFNLNLIKSVQAQKIRQQKEKQQIAAFQKHQNQQYLDDIKKGHEKQEKMRNQFKQQIQKQVQYKYRKSQQQLQMSKQVDTSLDIGKQSLQYYKNTQYKQKKYRQQLLKQIKQRKQQVKEVQIQKKRMNNLGIGITQASYERQIQRAKQNQIRKRQLLQQRHYRNKIIQRQEQQKKYQRQQIYKQQIQNQFREKKLEAIRQLQRKKFNQSYIKDINRQINIKHNKRIQQQQQNLRAIDTSISIPQNSLQSKNCKSCDKKFVKTYLTKLN